MTVLELLLHYLPERYVDIVVNNTRAAKREHWLSREATTIHEELLTLFEWENSPQGFEFWDALLEAISDGEDLPPIPIDIRYAPNTIILTPDSMYLMNSQDTGINYGFDVDYKKIKTTTVINYEKICAFLN